MSATLTYTGQPRAELGTKIARKSRAAGKVPLTISRKGQPSHHLWLDVKSANELAAKVVHLCRIEVDGKKYTTLRGEVVKHPLTDAITHIDLLEVDEKGEIKVDVAVRVDSRNCAGVKAGGIVEQRLRVIKVKCPANAIPDALDIDITDVEIMQTVLVEKVTLPKGVSLVTPGKAILLSVVIPRGMSKAEDTAATPAEGAAPADGAAAPAAGAPAAGAAPAKGAAPAAAAPAKDAGKGDKKK